MIEQGFRFVQITTHEDLAFFFDDIAQAIVAMLHRTGAHGVSAERIMVLMSQNITTNGFVLLALRDSKNGSRNYDLAGLLFALFVPDNDPWVEVIALWIQSGFSVSIRDNGFKLLKVWAKERGASKIISILTRSPDVFFNMFHRPLGFAKVGIVVEVKL